MRLRLSREARLEITAGCVAVIGRFVSRLITADGVPMFSGLPNIPLGAEILITFAVAAGSLHVIRVVVGRSSFCKEHLSQDAWEIVWYLFFFPAVIVLPAAVLMFIADILSALKHMT